MIVWDRPYYYIKGRQFIPEIGMNTALIKLSGHLQADLDWKLERVRAKQFIQEGFAIFWEMDLGLFSNLKLPLTNQTQFLSLTLSLDHFRNTLWKEFGDQTVGLSLFSGNVDLSRSLKIDRELEDKYIDWLQQRFQDKKSTPERNALFCRDVSADYLALLASRLPDEIPAYASLDAGSLSNNLLQALYLHPECWERLNIYVKNSQLPMTSLGYAHDKATLGICLPLMDYCHMDRLEPFEKVINGLIQEGISFRFIAESQLTSQWDGLDKLIYVPEATSVQGRRKLQGFAAAGGEIISAEEFEI